MTRRSQKQKAGNSSGNGSGKPHLACPPATEHQDVVRQIFESLNIQFERLRSDPVMRGQRDPTTLHNFAALLNRAVTPVTTEEKIVFETIRYLADANRAKLCRWMFSAHLACISLCADERLVALGLNVPSDILVAMRPDGALVIRHAGPSGTSEFGGKRADSSATNGPSPTTGALKAPTGGAATKPQEAQRGAKDPPSLTAEQKARDEGSYLRAANPAKSGKAEKRPDTATGDSNLLADGLSWAVEPATHPAIDAPIRDNGAGRKRDVRRPVVTDARYQQVLESLKAATAANPVIDAAEPKKQGTRGPQDAPIESSPAAQDNSEVSKNTQSALDARHSAQSIARPNGAADAPATNGQPCMPQSYRDAVATIPARDKKKTAGTPNNKAAPATGAAKAVEAAPSPIKPVLSKTGATPTTAVVNATAALSPSAPKRVLSRIEEDTEMLLDFIRVAPVHSDSNLGGEAQSSPRSDTPIQPALESPTQAKISWADALSDEEDKEIDLAVQRLRQPQPEPKLKSQGHPEVKRSVTFARPTGRDARGAKDAQDDKKSNRRGGRRHRRRDHSTATSSNSA